MLASLKNITVSDPTQCLTPKKIIAFPIYEQAYQLNLKIKDHIANDEIGLYLPNQTKPIVTPDTRLRRKDGALVVWQEIPSMKEDLYNSKGQVVLSKKMLANQLGTLSTSADVPQVVLNIIRQYVELTVASHCPWANPSYSQSRFLHNFLADSVNNSEIDPEEEVSKACSGFLREVVDFVSESEDSTWAIYFTKLVAGNIYLIRSIDWRVYQWMSDMHEKQNQDNDVFG